MPFKNISAFEPLGPTVLVAADSTAPTGVATVTTGSSVKPICQFRVCNNGTVTVFYAYSTTAALAAAAAVIPTGSGSNAKASYALPAGGVEVITAPRDSFWSGITAAGTASLFVTPCVGV